MESEKMHDRDTDDLISRKAAIYIASGYCHPANIAKELAKLPSAQQYTDEEIQKIQDLEQAEIEKAYELGREEGRKEAQPEHNPDDERKIADLHRIVNYLLSQPDQRWIPIKWHDCTDEDREKYGFSNEIVAVFDCEMPNDDQAILVTTSHGYVNQDVCYIDDGYSLDSGYDWIEDITAWMPLPEPYQPKENEQ